MTTATHNPAEAAGSQLPEESVETRAPQGPAVFVATKQNAPPDTFTLVISSGITVAGISLAVTAWAAAPLLEHFGRWIYYVPSDILSYGPALLVVIAGVLLAGRARGVHRAGTYLRASQVEAGGVVYQTGGLALDPGDRIPAIEGEVMARRIAVGVAFTASVAVGAFAVALPAARLYSILEITALKSDINRHYAISDEIRGADCPEVLQAIANARSQAFLTPHGYGHLAVMLHRRHDPLPVIPPSSCAATPQGRQLLDTLADDFARTRAPWERVAMIVPAVSDQRVYERFQAAELFTLEGMRMSDAEDAYHRAQALYDEMLADQSHDSGTLSKLSVTAENARRDYVSARAAVEAIANR